MFFIALTFLAAFLIEGLGTATSVIGLSALFGANPIIIALAIALDVGKIVVVSLLYTYWRELGKTMKTYALIAATITMMITSAGAAGYLMGEFQKAIIGSQEGGLRVDALKQEQIKLEARKKQIDDQIAAIPEKYSATQRIRLMNQFKEEQKRATDRLAAIDQELPTLQVKQLGVEAKAGPILTIAKSFEIPVEQAIKYVILMIIFVFDPLAVFLIIAGNFLVAQRKKKLEAPTPTEPDDDIRVPRREDAINPISEEQLEQIKAEVREKKMPRVEPDVVELPPLAERMQKFDISADLASAEKKVYDDMHPRIIDLATPVVPEVTEPAKADEPTEPLFEVLQPSPGVVAPQPDIVPDPAPMPATATQTPAVPSHRSEITLNDLTAPSEITLNSLKQPVAKSSAFDEVPNTGDVTFVTDPQPTGARTVYQGQRR